MSQAMIPSFGRRKGRKLSARREGLLQELLPKLQVPLPAEDVAIERQALAPDKTPLDIEIGFGGGEHLLSLATTYPERQFIGCEPYFNGVATLLDQWLQAGEPQNLKLLTDDARLLLSKLPAASVDNIYILFPDPWPKERHHKRRLITAELLSMLARVQKPGGQLLLATDHEDYASWMLEKLIAHPDYAWLASQHTDWKTPPAHWVHTRYERKTTLEGRPPLFFQAHRKQAA